MLVKRTKQNNWYIPEGRRRPPQSWIEKLGLFKKLYISIWLKKVKLAARSHSLAPLRRL